MLMELLSVSVGDSRLKGADLLIHSCCIEDLNPKLFQELSCGMVPLCSCLEREHINMIVSKVATIIKTANPRMIRVLTVDGSPHCAQLHYAVQQAKALTGSSVQVEHMVIEHGKLYRISEDTVKLSRHLSHIQMMKEKSPV